MSLPEHPTGAEEFLGAELEIADASPASHRTVYDTLNARQGVGRVSINGHLVTVLYDATLETCDALVHALAEAGLEVRHSETHRESPIAEIEDQVQPFLEKSAGPGPEH